MKRTILSLLAAVVLAVGVGFSPLQAQKDYNNYARVQYSNPIGQYKDFYSQGFGLEFGRRFYSSLVLSELVVPGLDVTFLELGFNSGRQYGYNPYIDETGREVYDYLTRDGFLLTAGPKVGIAAKMELIDGLFIEAAVKYCPTLVFGSRTLGRTALNPTVESASCFAFSNRLSVNFELKYSMFSIGGEFCFFKSNLDYTKDIIPFPDETPVLQDKIDLGMNTFKLYLGVNF